MNVTSMLKNYFWNAAILYLAESEKLLDSPFLKLKAPLEVS